jgi:hypothetical protein
MATGNVLILSWRGSGYDSINGLLRITAQELEAEGLTVEVYAGDGAEWYNKIPEQLTKRRYNFALTMSGAGADLTLRDGRLLWEAAEVPLFNWNCDHPCYRPHHVIYNNYLLHGYVFPDHARYSIANLPSNGAAFAVHIGVPPRGLFPAAPLPGTARNGRIMFSKSGLNINAMEANWNRMNPILRNTLFEASESLFHHNTADFLPVLREVAERRGLFLTGDSDLTLTLLGSLDHYVRNKRSELVVRTLLPYPVDVFGAGWDYISFDGAHARRLGPLGWNETVERLPDYLGSLSLNPLIDESVHDRVFFALAAGVVPVSDSNAFSRTNMPALESYNFTFTPERIRHAIEALLSDPAEALGRTETTYQALSDNFSARRSASRIINFAGLHGSNKRIVV